MTKKKYIDQEGPNHKERPKKLEIHNLPTDDVEHIESTNMGRDLLLDNKLRTVPWGTEKTHKEYRVTAEIFYIYQHIINESKTRRKDQAMAWIDNKKAYDIVTQSWIIYCHKKVQNIRWSHKLFREIYENLESGIGSRREKLSWTEDPDRYI